MIGIFLVSDKDELGFMQPGDHAEIASFRYHTETAMCIAVLRSGEEETFDDAIHDVIQKTFALRTEVLVAHIAEDGRIVTEYTVPLAVVQ